MITVKLQNLLDVSTVFQGLTSKPLKARVAFLVARMAKEMEKELDIYEESRKKLIDECVERDSEGEYVLNEDKNGYILRSDKIEDFNRQMQELLDTEINLNVDKIKLDDLGDVDFTASQMFMLESLIEE